MTTLTRPPHARAPRAVGAHGRTSPVPEPGASPSGEGGHVRPRREPKGGWAALTLSASTLHPMYAAPARARQMRPDSVDTVTPAVTPPAGRPAEPRPTPSRTAAVTPSYPSPSPSPSRNPAPGCLGCPGGARPPPPPPPPPPTCSPSPSLTRTTRRIRRRHRVAVQGPGRTCRRRRRRGFRVTCEGRLRR